MPHPSLATSCKAPLAAVAPAQAITSLSPAVESAASHVSCGCSYRCLRTFTRRQVPLRSHAAPANTSQTSACKNIKRQPKRKHTHEIESPPAQHSASSGYACLAAERSLSSRAQRHVCGLKAMLVATAPYGCYSAQTAASLLSCIRCVTCCCAASGGSGHAAAKGLTSAAATVGGHPDQ